MAKGMSRPVSRKNVGRANPSASANPGKALKGVVTGMQHPQGKKY